MIELLITCFVMFGGAAVVGCVLFDQLDKLSSRDPT
jgi:hypothetical protein